MAIRSIDQMRRDMNRRRESGGPGQRARTRGQQMRQQGPGASRQSSERQQTQRRFDQFWAERGRDPRTARGHTNPLLTSDGKTRRGSELAGAVREAAAVFGRTMKEHQKRKAIQQKGGQFGPEYNMDPRNAKDYHAEPGHLGYESHFKPQSHDYGRELIGKTLADIDASKASQEKAAGWHTMPDFGDRTAESDWFNLDFDAERAVEETANLGPVWDYNDFASAQKEAPFFEPRSEFNPFPVNHDAGGGNCTWYAHGRMRYMGYDPNALMSMRGNAKDWDWQAKDAGLRVDNRPAPGTIAQWDSHPVWGDYGHVAVVEDVYDDGSIKISDSGWSRPPDQVYRVDVLTPDDPRYEGAAFIHVPFRGMH